MIWYLVCVCVCVCIKRTRTCTITCTRTYMPAHPSIHPSIRIQWHSHTHTQMHTCTHTHMHACMHTHLLAHTHTYTYMHLYTHTTHTFLRWSYMHILAHTYILTDRQTDRRIISWLFQHFAHSEDSQDWPEDISTSGSLGHPFLCRAPCIRAVHGTCMKGPRSGMVRDGPLGC